MATDGGVTGACTLPNQITSLMEAERNQEGGEFLVG